jgi:hypothetical protein
MLYSCCSAVRTWAIFLSVRPTRQVFDQLWLSPLFLSLIDGVGKGSNSELVYTPR